MLTIFLHASHAAEPTISEMHKTTPAPAASFLPFTLLSRFYIFPFQYSIKEYHSMYSLFIQGLAEYHITHIAL